MRDEKRRYEVASPLVGNPARLTKFLLNSGPNMVERLPVPIIPPEIMAEARKIVAAHRPEGIAATRSDPLFMAGLKPEHHGELNEHTPRHEQETRLARLKELRSQYADDPVALQQIDVYDPESPYNDIFRKLSKAMRTGDKQKERELYAWLEEHYPDIKSD